MLRILLLIRITFVISVVSFCALLLTEQSRAQMPSGPLWTMLSLAQKKTYLGRPTSLLGQCFN
ncbi:MAG: hypothetical protein RMK80_05655, partial [Pseudobdellovibrionaceae bacterium]|nr:hypothetical protein [Pseudobdellovibrionaceae bacterium]